MDLAAESPRVEFSPENSRYSRRISRGDRKKFATKISLSQKKRREISHLIISSEPIYEAEARIFIVQSATESGSQCPMLLRYDKKSLRTIYFRNVL